MVICGRKRSTFEGHFSYNIYYFINPNGLDVRKWVSNLVFKFNNDPMVNESGIIGLLRHVWMYAGKIEDFGKGEEKMDLRERERRHIM